MQHGPGAVRAREGGAHSTRRRFPMRKATILTAALVVGLSFGLFWNAIAEGG
jgi:hypothetical protein